MLRVVGNISVTFLVANLPSAGNGGAFWRQRVWESLLAQWRSRLGRWRYENILTLDRSEKSSHISREPSDYDQLLVKSFVQRSLRFACFCELIFEPQRPTAGRVIRILKEAIAPYLCNSITHEYSDRAHQVEFPCLTMRVFHLY